MPSLPENIQEITQDVGDTELQQWLTNLNDAEINLPGLDIGIPVASRKIIDQSPTFDNQSTGEEDDDDTDDEPIDLVANDAEIPAAAEQASGTPDFFEVNGQQIPRADIERLHQFDQYLRANPDKATAVQQAIATQPVAPAAQTTTPHPVAEEFQEPTPPDFLDLDDPAQKFTWDTHVSTQKALFDRDQRDKQLFAATTATQTEARNRQARADMDLALDQFKRTHPNLNDDDIIAVRKAAGPFVPGMLSQLQPVDALVRSMEVGGMMDDNLRDKLMDTTVRTPTEKTRTRHRKARLGELSGSGRSAPKTESRPAFTSDKEFINAIAAELSESMQR